MKMTETCPMVNMSRDAQQNLALELVWTAERYRTHNSVKEFLTLDEQGAERLRNTCQAYLDERRVEAKNARFKAAYSAPPVVRRVSFETMHDIFNGLAETKEPFYCIFEKQDGSMRRMWAKMVAPVQYSYKNRSSYANVVDLDLERESDHNCDRKIVIQRVEALTVGRSEYIASGR